MFVSVPAQDLDINQYCLASYSEMYTLSIAFVRVLYALYNFQLYLYSQTQGAVNLDLKYSSGCKKYDIVKLIL
jgi:hypothetical protein